ncbi:hypothetical protein HPB48_020686 [Haemaphysalis longicornis]|uniref:G-protein coupled receptors family 1 profile domain-containing protein n=1 Tax=Haemaphysalis longicornis TaxID=44386 RepID=A0A9J6G2Q3_HAELO|nr:hypothetical protein HPB48_020686 [Haemaphysalis longicornis]
MRAASTCFPVLPHCLPLHAQVKTVKLTAAIFAAFLVTNVPYMVQEMVLAFASNGISLDRNLVALFGVISASNSAINPYIFLFFQKSSSKRKRFVMPFRRDAVAEGENATGRSSGERFSNSTKNQSGLFTLSTKDVNGKWCSELQAELSTL